MHPSRLGGALRVYHLERGNDPSDLYNSQAHTAGMPPSPAHFERQESKVDNQGALKRTLDILAIQPCEAAGSGL